MKRGSASGSQSGKKIPPVRKVHSAPHRDSNQVQDRAAVDASVLPGTRVVPQQRVPDNQAQGQVVADALVLPAILVAAPEVAGTISKLTKKKFSVKYRRPRPSCPEQVARAVVA